MRRIALAAVLLLALAAVAGVARPEGARAVDGQTSADSIMVTGSGSVAAVPSSAVLSFGVDTRAATANIHLECFLVMSRSRCAVQFQSRTSPQQWLDFSDMAGDLGLLVRGPAVRVVRTAAHAVDQDVDRSAEQDDVAEAVVEGALVLDSARDDHVRMPGQQAVHPVIRMRVMRRGCPTQPSRR